MYNEYVAFILKSQKLPDRWRVTLHWSAMVLGTWDFVTLDAAREFMELIELQKELPYPKQDF